MPGELMLSELTASLVQELARSAAVAERAQRNEFVALAEEVAVPLAEYVERAATPERVEQAIARMRATEEPIHAEAVMRQRDADLRLQAVTQLREEAAARHRDVTALLRARMPKVEISRGSLDVKVLLHEGADGKVGARLATADAVAGAHDVVSTLHVEFGVGAFPALET